jgi:hypothetical protein
VADEGEVEEDGRERDEEGDDQVFEAAAGHGDQSFLRGERQWSCSCCAASVSAVEWVSGARREGRDAMPFIATAPPRQAETSIHSLWQFRKKKLNKNGALFC